MGERDRGRECVVDRTRLDNIAFFLLFAVERSGRSKRMWRGGESEDEIEAELTREDPEDEGDEENEEEEEEEASQKLREGSDSGAESDDAVWRRKAARLRLFPAWQLLANPCAPSHVG